MLQRRCMWTPLQVALLLLTAYTSMHVLIRVVACSQMWSINASSATPFLLKVWLWLMHTQYIVRIRRMKSPQTLQEPVLLKLSRELTPLEKSGLVCEGRVSSKYLQVAEDAYQSAALINEALWHCHLPDLLYNSKTKGTFTTLRTHLSSLLFTVDCCAYMPDMLVWWDNDIPRVIYT